MAILGLALIENEAYPLGDKASLWGGRIAAMTLVWAVLLFFGKRARRALGEPEVVRNGPRSFLLLTAAVLVAPATSLMGALAPNLWTPVTLALVGLTCGLPALAGALLGLVALGEGIFSKPRRTKGLRWAAGTLTTLALMSLLSMVAAAAGKGNRGGSAGGGAGHAGDSITVSNQNFTFRSPPRPWVPLDAKKFNKAASLAFVRREPDLFLMIVAEAIGLAGASDEALADLVKANLRSSAPGAEFSEMRKVERPGPPGLEMDARFPIGGKTNFVRYRVFVTNGFAYQLVVTGAEPKGLGSEIESLFSGFASKPLSSPAVPGVYRSRRFAFSFTPTLPGWRQIRPGGSNILKADFCASGPGGDLGLAVIPVGLTPAKMSDDAVWAALSALFDVEFPSPEAHDERPFAKGLAHGLEFALERPNGERRFAYRFRLARAGANAWLVAAYGDAAAGVNDTLAAALDMVALAPEAPEPLAADSDLDAAEKRRHAGFFNAAGLFEHRARRYAPAAEYFHQALLLSSKSVVYLLNEATALEGDGRVVEAVALLEGHRDLTESNPQVRCALAGLLERTGRTAEAATHYAAAFAGGYRNDEAFSAYATLIAKTRGAGEAIAEIDAHLKRGESKPLRVMEARLWGDKGEPARSVEILKALAGRYPHDLDTAVALALARLSAGDSIEALADCDRLVAAQPRLGGAWVVKARAESSLKRYREAKRSYEEAQRLFPADADLGKSIDALSNILGEGGNSSVKEPIDPVPVPESLTPGDVDDAPPAYVKDAGARILWRLTAVAFDPGKDWRETESSLVKIVDGSGAAAFGTLQFPFSPVAASIFVNRLVVRDENGGVIGRGKVEDSYVTDTSSTVASDRKMLNVPVPGLRPGCTLEFAVTRRENSPPKSFPFTSHSALSFFPMVRDVFVVRARTNDFRIVVAGGYEAPHFGEVMWTEVRRPSVFRAEPWGDNPAEFEPRVAVGDRAGSWTEEARTYLGALRDRMTLNDAGARLAMSAAPDGISEGEKARRVAACVRTNLAYKAIEFGRRARIPHPTDEILRNRWGDCKDHALLLHQMLRTVGVESRLALVSTAGRVLPELPSLDQFDHMVVWLPGDGGGRFIDCTDKGFDDRYPAPNGLAECDALVLDGEKSRLVSVPPYPAGSSRIAISRTCQLTNGADLWVHETAEFHGYIGADVRGYFLGISATGRRAYVEALFNRRDAELKSFDARNLNDPTAPLIWESNYMVRRRFKAVDRELLGRLPAVVERVFGIAEPSEPRLTPFRLTHDLVMETSASLDVPAGYRVQSNDTSTQRFASGGNAAQSELKTGEKTVVTQTRFQRGAGRFPASDYARFRDGLVKALDLVEPSVSFTRDP